MGIRVIYQEPEIVPDLSVAENLYINELPKQFGIFVRWNELFHNAHEQLAKLGFEGIIPLKAKVGALTPAQRQLVEILRAMKDGVRVLALDEPTSSLSDEEAQRLFELVRRLREQGLGIIYVSHRLREIVELSDRVAILRDGELVTVQPTRELTELQMLSQMVGRPFSKLFSHENHTQSDVVMRVKGLSSVKLKDVSFELHRGEVLGIAGLVGAGRTSLGKICGAHAATSGTIDDGKRSDQVAPRRHESGHLLYPGGSQRGSSAQGLERPGERQPGYSGSYSLPALRESPTRMGNRLRHDPEAACQNTVAGTDSEQTQRRQPAKGDPGSLAGASPKVLILDEPTRGIDVGAKAEIYTLVSELAAQGYGVIVISSELPEILGMSNRILVMNDGRVTGELTPEQASEEDVLRLAMADHLSQAS
jgi:L-arabinose transport system ATP-binding protein